MTKPNSRSTLKDYCLRKLGYPVLEINVDDDQIDDLLDDGIQYFQERHFDGIERVYLKHKLTEADITTAKSTETTSSATTGINNGITSFGNADSFIETNNYLKLPDHVIGVEKVFKMDASTISSGLFNIKYQLFLNDLYYYGALDLMNYAMTKTYLEDLSRLITPDTQIRFNKKQHNLYLDVDWAEMTETWIIMDCYRLVDPGNAIDIYNDWWLKRYVTALIKKQWGQNLIKFQGVMLPGGIQLNGRQIYDDAVKELEQIEYELKTEYELPPMDLIG
tara:strand:- start:434 stop:1264 length:831 start_codon:yes stop_codon:yes gene_type:complete